MAKKGYDAGVKEYRDTYWMPEYEPKDTDILACFKITPQPGAVSYTHLTLPTTPYV